VDTSEFSHIGFTLITASEKCCQCSEFALTFLGNFRVNTKLHCFGSRQCPQNMIFFMERWLNKNTIQIIKNKTQIWIFTSVYYPRNIFWCYSNEHKCIYKKKCMNRYNVWDTSGTWVISTVISIIYKEKHFWEHSFSWSHLSYTLYF